MKLHFKGDAMKANEQLYDKAKGRYSLLELGHSRFNQSLTKLPSRFQEVLVLRYVAGLRVEDIAVIMTMPTKEASELLQEAHEAMVKEMDSKQEKLNFFVEPFHTENRLRVINE